MNKISNLVVAISALWLSQGAIAAKLSTLPLDRLRSEVIDIKTVFEKAGNNQDITEAYNKMEALFKLCTKDNNGLPNNVSCALRKCYHFTRDYLIFERIKGVKTAKYNDKNEGSKKAITRNFNRVLEAIKNFSHEEQEIDTGKQHEENVYIIMSASKSPTTAKTPLTSCAPISSPAPTATSTESGDLQKLISWLQSFYFL